MGKQWNFKPNKNIQIRSRKGAARGLRLAGEHLLGESNKHVPIEEATLERSGTVSVDENKLVGAVSYDTPYAVKQHEDLNLRHDSGRTAKYLENAFNTEADTVAKIIADAIKGEL